MLWEQLQDKLVCIAGVLLTMFLLGYLLYRCCSHAVDNGYRTLMNVQDELGIDELFKVRLGILQGAIFMAIDVTLDNVNGIIYCWRGLKVFGPLTLAIPVVSGFCCFVYKRNSWALAPIDHTDAAGKKTDFLFPKTRSKWAIETGLEECNPSDAAGGGFRYSLCGLQRAKETWAGVEGRNCFQWCCGRLPIGFASNVHSVLHGTFKLPPRCLQHLHQHCVHPLFVLQHWQGLERGLFGTSSTDKGGATTWRIDDHSAESAAEPRCFCPNLCSGSYWHKSSTSSWYDSKQSVLPASLNAVGTVGHLDTVQVVLWVAVILCRRFHPFHCAGIFVTANAGGKWCQFASTASHPTVHDDVASNGTCWWLNPCLVQHSREPTEATPLRGQFCSCRCLLLSLWLSQSSF